MSDERWLPIRPAGPDITTPRDAMRLIAKTYYAAEGQRVEMIHWCTTHGAREDVWGCPGERRLGGCVIVAATLILPPEAAS